ncbi:MAG: hypothetical protein HQK50_09690 [Oligoflexia bacterium]|nr:hypothetical protein [Oligoflexia bacterium]MBF0365834.1 hypothetical protein [Oligoflexia bacterium]
MADKSDEGLLKRLLNSNSEIEHERERTHESIHEHTYANPNSPPPTPPVGESDYLHQKVGDLKDAAKHLDNNRELNISKKAVGVDVGTSRIVSARIGGDYKEITQSELNAFFMLPFSTISQDLLTKNKMNYVKTKDNLAVYGIHGQVFANMFNGELLRPMKDGLLKSEEPNAVHMIKEIISLVVNKPEELGSKLCFSIPAPRLGSESDLIFHEAILKKYFVAAGYNAISINEGLAVVLSELAHDNYTGIGISMGAGMCNICFSFMSVPIIVFGLHQGGDLIDQNVARVVNESATRVRVIKEESLDLGKSPKNNLEQALHIYYDDLISRLVNALASTFSKTENLPKLAKPIPLVLGGGTCVPAGFKVKFDKMLRQVELPIEISETKLAADPLRATARGALVCAGAE